MTTATLSQPQGVTNRTLDSPRAFFDFLKATNQMRSPRVLVVGGSSYRRGDVMRDVLAKLDPKAVVLTGDHKGAQALARKLAPQAGHATAIFPTPWDLGAHLRPNPAPAARNALMLACNPGQVLVFSSDIKSDTQSRDIASKAYFMGAVVTIVDQHGATFTHQRQDDPTLKTGDLKKDAEKLYGKFPT